jgi:hypothetical protein
MKDLGWRTGGGRALCLGVILSIFGLACSSSDGERGPDPGRSDASADAAAPDSNAATPMGPDVRAATPVDSGSGPEVGSTPRSCGRTSGACTNESDCSKSATEMQAKVAECGRRCLGAASCTANCMKDGLALTAGCAQCWGTFVQCGRDSCLVPCAAGRDTPECLACTASAGCEKTFAACAGL